MLKGQDILVLLRLMTDDRPPATIRELDETLHLGTAPIHRSLARLREAGLISEDRVVRHAQVDEFLAHAARYIFPPKLGGEARGIPTAWAAPPLNERISGSGLPPVWPHPLGETRGLALDPIHKTAPDAARRSSELYERLAIFDGLRLGDSRQRGVAREELQRAMRASA